MMSIFICAIAATGAFAQASRTWVAGLGDDANPCSRTFPCKTFAGAFPKTAAGGQISVVDPGAYGTLTITKAITIEGGGELGSMVNAGFNGFVIAAGPNDNVTLRNLQIDGVTSGKGGIVINSAGSVQIEDTAIVNQVDAGSGRGILISPTSGNVNVFIHDVAIYHCALNGVQVAPAGGTANVYMDDVRISNIGLPGSVHDGIDMKSGANVSLNNVRVTGSTGAGLVVEASTATVDNSVFERNSTDGITIGSGIALVRLSSSTTTQNSGAGVHATGGGLCFSYRNNSSSDNSQIDSPSSQATFY